MLSICIPIYNFDATSLVGQLHQQVVNNSLPAEIICIDDGSSDKFREINEIICSSCSTYIKLNSNTGRARVRNIFVNYAQYDYLLFIDCDSMLIAPDYLQQYYDVISNRKEVQVVCGGRNYPLQKPGKEKLLRWKYGHFRECKPVEQRKQDPNRSFMTNNFLIRKALLKEIRFDENISGYGHEDTLFGFMLWKKKFSVDHINNPVMNNDIEDNEEFLIKTETGLKNLVYVSNTFHSEKNILNFFTVLKFYSLCNSFKILFLIKFLYQIFNPVIRKMLKKGIINLQLFDFYKLGYYIHIKSKIKL
jgi:glycosyltransferase involved in cell wall biosynthesis